jgi:hypothetical protein
VQCIGNSQTATSLRPRFAARLLWTTVALSRHLLSSCCLPCCRIVSSLTRLAHLSLLQASAPPDHPSPPPGHVLLPLQQLTTVTVDAGSVAALHMLARWTRVRDCGITLGAEDIERCLVSVKGWSVGWLRAKLLLDSRASQSPYEQGFPAGYVLVDDDDVAALGTALMGLDGLMPGGMGLVMYLGAQVTPTGLWQFPACSRLAFIDLGEDDFEHVAPGSYVAGWSEALVPTPAHFQAVIWPGLVELTVENAQMTALPSAAPGLQVLHVEHAVSLSDHALELCASTCPQLQALWLLHVSNRVTAAGLLPLLVSTKSLQLLVVGRDVWAGRMGDFAADFVSELQELYPELLTKWSVTPGLEGQRRQVVFNRR